MPPSLLSKSLATATSAAVLLACPVAAGAHTPHQARPTASHKHKPATHDHLAGPRRGATHAVNAQLKAVAALQTQAAAFTGADASALQTAVAADQAAMQADLAGIPTANSVRGLRALVKSAGVSRQIARTQVVDVVAADEAGAQGASLTTTVSTLATSLAGLADGGTDTTTGQAAVTDATTQLGTVSTNVPVVVSTVLAIAPTAPAAALHLAAATADDQLAAVTAALTATSADITSIQTTYGL